MKAKNRIFGTEYTIHEPREKHEIIECHGCAYYGTIPILGKGCRYAEKTDKVRGCTAKECYEKRICFKEVANVKGCC